MRFTNVTGSATSDLRIDKITGWITEAKISKVLKGTVEVQDTPKTAGGMTFLMSVTGDLMVSAK